MGFQVVSPLGGQHEPAGAGRDARRSSAASPGCRARPMPSTSGRRRTTPRACGGCVIGWPQTSASSRCHSCSDRCCPMNRPWPGSRTAVKSGPRWQRPTSGPDGPRLFPPAIPTAARQAKIWIRETDIMKNSVLTRKCGERRIPIRAESAPRGKPEKSAFPFNGRAARRFRRSSALFEHDCRPAVCEPRPPKLPFSVGSYSRPYGSPARFTQRVMPCPALLVPASVRRCR